MILNLEGTASSSSTSSLEFSSLGAHIRFGGAVGNTWCFSHVTASFSCSTATLYQQGVLTGRSFQCELVEGENLTSCFQHTDTGTFCEPECTDGQLRDIKKSDVISDCSHHNTDLITFGSFHPTNDTGQRDRWFVDLAHEQPFQDNLVELGIRSSGKETVQLHEDSQVGVLGDWSISVLLLVLVVLNINTHVGSGLTMLIKANLNISDYM